jgi:HAMP domain-containing protein
MFKSLTARAIVPIAVSVTGFVVVCCILLYSLMKADLIGDAVEYENSLTNTIVRSASYAMLTSDREMLANIIDNIGVQEGIEHVRIFNKKGLIMFSRDHAEVNSIIDKKTAGCIGCHRGEVPETSLGAMEKARQFVNARGTEVLAITAPIYNEPACSTADCHFHPPGQKVLGTLDVGVSTAHLNRTLAQMRYRMTVFSVMVLVLCIGGVAALLQRNVFLPLREIREFTSQANHGTLSGKLTGISGELAELAGDVRTLAARLEKTEQKLVELESEKHTLQEQVSGEAG